MNDKIYPSMVIRSQAEAIELLEKENADLKQRLNVVNEMNVANYNKYCEELKENTQLKSVIKEIRECIEKFPLIHYTSVEKVEGKRLSGKLVPVDDLLQILDKGENDGTNNNN